MRFPVLPPPFWAFVGKPEDMATIVAHVSPVLPDGRYLHWDELRWRPPPSGVTKEQWWAAQKMGRLGGRVQVPGFMDEKGKPFWFCRLDAIDRATHQLDRRDAVREMLEAVGDDTTRTHYRIDQLIEEAINSSLIEGAKLTTRAQAKAMVRDGRVPASKGERMVANNFSAMNRLLQLADRQLTLDDLLEIHAILGDKALDAQNAEGRLRTPSDHVRVEDSVTGEIWFTPPPAEFLEHKLSQLLTFANKQADGPFLHPLLRAITLHFWLAYLHPFVDGNGRMARALFYWQMLRSGYDIAQYLSISGPIDRSKSAYYRAFAYTETDENDLTYFLLNQLGALSSATDDLLTHLRERSRQLGEISRVLSSSDTFNHRQQAALSHLVRHPHPGVTVAGHAKSHSVSYLTARKDLQGLVQADLLKQVRVGKTDNYRPSEQFQQRLMAHES